MYGRTGGTLVESLTSYAGTLDLAVMVLGSDFILFLLLLLLFLRTVILKGVCDVLSVRKCVGTCQGSEGREAVKVQRYRKDLRLVHVM